MAAAAVIVIASVVVALVALPELTAARTAGLISLVVAELYISGVIFYARWGRKGDGNNFIPAVLSGAVPLIISVIALVIAVNTVMLTILYVVAWAIALVALFVALAANHAETVRAETPPDADGVKVVRGKA